MDRHGRHVSAISRAPGGSAILRSEFDIVVVGAGFGGLYALHRFRQLGLSVRVFERGSGIGGTWFWNRYPGARCDVESLAYSYQFSSDLEQEWDWADRYAAQPEILDYANHVADRFELRDDIQLDTSIVSAHFEETRGRWRLRSQAGEEIGAQFLVMATGCLSSTNLPDFKGLDRFAGSHFHTGAWPEEGVDFSGQRVGIIGTGSSAIQAIPILAEQSRELFVFQRTPNFSMPARNTPMNPAYQSGVKADYDNFRKPFVTALLGTAIWPGEKLGADTTTEERRVIFEEFWRTGGLGLVSSFPDILSNREVNDAAAEFVRERIRETVDDPEVAELLSPRTVLGCKRPCADSGYYETYNRENVTLVDISEAPIDEITENGLRTGGRDYDLDCIIFATGFDAMTGSLLRIDVRGRDGLTLNEAWADGPRNYLGLNVAGFPNFFTITGPGSPSVLANMIPGIEQHVNWIADCIEYLRAEGFERIEATAQAESDWIEHVDEVAGRTLFPTCNSWYLGANIPGKPRRFMPYLGFPPYVKKCEEVAAMGYEGFHLE
ncbi:MAG: NAD(P)/FAD-dependent oxidoreductase [bacterium]|nr:cyclohexanone monooxygenase [Deltaproteobacteria bacterium]MCP4905154.1 NAD(P)/FAD-dependent oxidoreductase [bacterium]